MGWRDRVKKSFGDSEHIGEGIQNSKKIEKERKEGSKTTFIYYPQNPQNPQNRQNEGEKPKTDQGTHTARLKIKAQITGPRRKISRHRHRQAWAMNMKPYGTKHGYWLILIDGDSAPLADRRAKLPELDETAGPYGSH
jgi:hypothetical protein